MKNAKTPQILFEARVLKQLQGGGKITVQINI